MKKVLILIFLLFLVVYDLFSQCSDAGICTLKDHQQNTAKRFSVGISYLYGKSSKVDDINYHTARVDGSASLQDNVVLSFLIPYNSQSGPLGSVSGIGDIIGAVQYKFLQSSQIELSVQAGMKFSTGDANKSSGLPQRYQNGLGSNDLLFGIYGVHDLYNFTIGYQKAGERNNNAVTRLKRGDDLLVRVGATVPVEPFIFNISYLLIRRLSTSSVQDTSLNGTFVDIPKSDQTQLNIVADIDVQLNETLTLRSGFAFPFLKRDVNVDGLTRAITLSFGFLAYF